MVEFSADELGTYVLLYSTASYSVTFYEDKIIYPNKDKGVVDLTEIKNILEEFKNIEWRTT